MQFKELNMLLVLLITWFSISPGQTRCNSCIEFDDVCTETTYLFDIQAPFREDEVIINKLGILNSKHRLYYVFEPKVEDTEIYKIGFVDIDNPDSRNFGIVSGDMNYDYNFRTFAFDQANSIVYVGGHDGVYKLDCNNKAVLHSASDDWILSLFYRKSTIKNEAQTSLLQRRKREVHYELKTMLNVVIDENNVLIYTNKSGLYAGTPEGNVVQLSSEVKDTIRGLEIDLNGIVYTWWVGGDGDVYKVVWDSIFENSKLIKVAKILRLGSLTFDQDNNIVYNSGRQIFRMTRTYSYVPC